MTQKDIERKQIILINYIQSLVDEFAKESWKVKAEYSTNDQDLRVIVVQEQPGEKVVFFGDCPPIYNYYMFNVYGNSIEEEKNMSLLLNFLIGKNVYIDDVIYIDNNKVTHTEKWQIMFKQFSNFQPIEFIDIRRVGYSGVLHCIVNKIADEI